MRTFLVITATAFAYLGLSDRPSYANEPPNIVLILADDLGWSDLGCYGSNFFETPHLDRLAESGLRFTQAYAPAPICSASRAAIQTGKSTARLGFEFVTKNEGGYQPVMAPLRAPPFTLNLPLPEKSIAECLAEANYESAFMGKWHLNAHFQGYLGWSPTHGPSQQGYAVTVDRFGSHPYSYWNRKSSLSFADLPAGKFAADELTDAACEYLEQTHERPFFLMLSHYYVHTPVHTRAKWLYDSCARRLPDDLQRREAITRYASMVTTLDHLIGRVLESLEATGARESTLIVFTSDNGGHPEFAGNAPLRGSKWNLYEGGIRVPFIASWPGEIPANSVEHAAICGIDLLPTFADVAGVAPPDFIDGTSLVPLWKAPQLERTERSLLWHFPYYHPEREFPEAPKSIGINDGYTSQTRPHSALRRERWKLLHFYEDDRDELYDLNEDRGEQHDLSQQNPQRTQSMRQELAARLSAVNARLPTVHPEWQE